ncbi:hypothetical protein Dimus_011246 [Dionaea muscipula]
MYHQLQILIYRRICCVEVMHCWIFKEVSKIRSFLCMMLYEVHTLSLTNCYPARTHKNVTLVWPEEREANLFWFKWRELVWPEECGPCSCVARELFDKQIAGAGDVALVRV